MLAVAGIYANDLGRVSPVFPTSDEGAPRSLRAGVDTTALTVQRLDATTPIGGDGEQTHGALIIGSEVNVVAVSADGKVGCRPVEIRCKDCRLGIETAVASGPVRNGRSRSSCKRTR